MKNKRYVIGVDYGSDSCRALLADVVTGREVATSVSMYRRWSEGLYCDPLTNRYRQHPLDYIESLEAVISGVLEGLYAEERLCVEGIAFDCTASTPALVDAEGTPLALIPGYEDNPDAMFVLWKDHTAIADADDINTAAHSAGTDYTSYSGGTYSPEWAWSKILHILRTDSAIADAAYSWVEHCDWMSGLLTGNTKPETIARNRCAAGHKAMWNSTWDGLPSEEFLSSLDPKLGAMRKTLGTETVVNGTCVGTLTAGWAERLGLSENVKVATGSIDAHIGAIGAGIRPNVMTRIMGTSCCDILVGDAGGKLIKGICGQVDGSVLPGLDGFEAGQSAFGDIYAWFRRILLWAQPADPDSILARLGEEAAALPDEEDSVLALDWMNGRRTPNADQRVKGMICGITLGTTAPMLYKALVEATALGSRAICECYAEGGVDIRSIIAVGGIASKSEFVMQTLCDALQREISVVATTQACALGSAMCAATAAGICPTLADAQKALASPISKVYVPNPARAGYFDALYRKYLSAGAFEQERSRG